MKANFVETVSVTDPDSGGEVHFSIFKLESGGMIGVDASFIEQEVGPVFSPFDRNIELQLEEGN